MAKHPKAKSGVGNGSTLTPTKPADLAWKADPDQHGEPKANGGTFPPGELLAGRFRIVRWIATGGMGEVYEAEDLELGEAVAVKRIRREIADDRQAMERFWREITLARRVTHLGICRIFDVFRHPPLDTSEIRLPSASADAEGSDAASADAESSDAASADAESSDAESSDAESSDAESSDAESSDAESSDAESSDAEGSDSSSFGFSNTLGSVSERTIFLTMELLNGPTLRDHLRQAGPLSPDEALPLVRQMSEALATAHDAGVVHRDFKSSNVILVESPHGVRPVVTDFGLARATRLAGDGPDVTATGEILGSPAYMSPEQVSGGEITPATDVYALGVVMFEMVTGRYPFEASSPLAMLVQRVQHEAPSPRQFAPELDSAWDAAILKCLAREPAERFSTTRELVAALEPEPPAPEPQRRRPWPEWLLLILVLVVALIAHPPLISWFSGSDEGVEVDSGGSLASRPSVAILGFQNLSGRSEADWLSTALGELLTAELNFGGQLRTVPGENVARMKIELALLASGSLSPDTLQDVGRYLHSDFVVQGSYFLAGQEADDPLRLDLSVQETAAGETVATLSQTATEAEFLELVARLGVELRRSLPGDGGAPVPAGVVQAALPSDPTAVRLYSQGLAALRSLDALNARDLLGQAIDAEPEFAPAHAALAEASAVLGYEADALEQIERAFELSDRLPGDERLAIEGAFHELHGRWDRAIEIYREQFNRFPDHLEIGLDLVRALTEGRQRTAAEETLTALRELPVPAGEDPRIDLLEADLGWSLDQYQRHLEASTRAAEKGRRLGARLLTAQARQAQGKSLWMLQRQEEAMAASREAHQSLIELGDLAGASRALNNQAIILTQRGDVEGALAISEEALAMLRRIGDRSLILIVLNNQALIYRQRGQLDQASRLYEEMLEVTKDARNQAAGASGLFNLATTRYFQGRTPAARQLLREAMDLAQEMGNVGLVATVRVGLGDLQFGSGELAAARQSYLEAFEIKQELGDRVSSATIGILFAQVDLVEDRFEAARHRFEQARDELREMGIEYLAIDAEFLLAQLALEEGRFADAIELARKTAQGFARGQRPAEQAAALGVEAQALLAENQVAAARRLIDQIAVSCEGFQAYCVELAIARAEVLAAEGRTGAAVDLLRPLLDQALAAERVLLAFDLRLALAKAKARAGNPEARSTLDTLAAEARARGFHRVARLAAETD